MDRRSVLLVFEKRRGLHAAVALIADELTYNAEGITLVEKDNRSVASLRHELRTDDWDRHSASAHAISNKDPLLWRDLSDVYAEIV